MVVFAGLMLMAIIMLALQQNFWTRRRFIELRLDAIHDLNWLLAEFLSNRITDPAYNPDQQFLHSWNAGTAKARSLFPDRAIQPLQQIDARICRPREGAAGAGPPCVRELIELREAALRALYRETGFRSPR
jgi:hypothetical protein